MEYGDGSLPAIDFEDFPNESSKLIKACEEWGCFRLFNHHKILPASLMADMKQVVTELLHLPVEIKKRNEPISWLVHTGYQDHGPGSLIEALSLYDLSSNKAIDEFCDQLGVSPHQRETINKYGAAVHELMMDLSKKICQGLDLANVSCFEGFPCQFRFNKYSFTPETIGSLGAHTHTDAYYLAILQDDETVGGLEVLNETSGEYVAVEPWPNSLFVNMGDITKAWSNGRFCNVKHRVVCKEGKTRVSIVSFIRGHGDTAVEPPPELVDEDQNYRRLYAPFTQGELEKLRITTKTMAGEALELLRTKV